ncbi:MAG: HAMP domain-containing histidine kinase [bacterium]|nr:HAMP domain-containing histidine kinase [bacterium]
MRRQILWSALAVGAVTLVAGLIAGAVIGRNLAKENEAELVRQAEATAALVTSSIRGNLPSDENGEGTTILRTLQIAKAIGGHDYVEAEIVGLDPARAVTGAPLNTPLLDSLGNDPPLDVVVETEVDGGPVLAYVRSVVVSQRRETRVLIGIGRSEPMLGIGFMLRPLVFSLGIGAIVAVMLAAGIATRIGRRLDRVAASSQSLAAGDFSVRVPDKGSDDVARLGAAFNEMAKRLEDGKRRERDFLMSVGHDLRTPLTTMRGYAEAIDAGEVDAGDLARVGGVLKRQTDRLSRLVEDLTMLARLEAREFALRPEDVDLAAHVRGLVDGYRGRAAALHINITPTLNDVGIVCLDPDRLGQIVENLIENALRYTPEGGTIEVQLSKDSGSIVLSVVDTGPGIDSRDLERVFERLYVAQRYRPVRAEGSGLGLSIVKELSDAMGGSVTVHSELGKGTTVTLRLPAQHE